MSDFGDFDSLWGNAFAKTDQNSGNTSNVVDDGVKEEPTNSGNFGNLENESLSFKNTFSREESDCQKSIPEDSAMHEDLADVNENVKVEMPNSSPG